MDKVNWQKLRETYRGICSVLNDLDETLLINVNLWVGAEHFELNGSSSCVNDAINIIRETLPRATILVIDK